MSRASLVSRAGQVCRDVFQPGITRGEPARLGLNLEYEMLKKDNKKETWRDVSPANSLLKFTILQFKETL